MKLQEALQHVKVVSCRPESSPVEQLVAHAVAALANNARVTTDADRSVPPAQGTLRVALTEASPSGQWISLALGADGTGEMRTTHGSLLYALFSRINEEWLHRDIAEVADGRHLHVTFPWLRNLSDFLVGSLRIARHFDVEGYLRQLAREGFTHVTVNGLGVPRPFESSPPGDVYFWFYDYSPDLDQFVDSTLLRGYYPADYLAANLAFLKRTAALAVQYGLTPGLHINSPRSMPEEFWSRHGYLRGARVDHPRETFRPRYTLAMAHPVTQQHYRELVRNIMAEVPEIGFVHVWTNDSGAGFEFVSSLYAGRNGGPYLIREWKSEEEIRRKAAENVLTYYRLLRDEGRKANPRFRLVCDLGPFYTERKYILAGLGDGIDAGSFGYFEHPEGEAKPTGDVLTHVKLDLSDNNVIGVPFPRLTHERLSAARMQHTGTVLAGITPQSLAPHDINGEVVRAVQLNGDIPVDELLRTTAVRWVGREHAETLTALWDLADTAVRSYPAGVPCSTFGFPWFRFWVRPFVPNIDAIPEMERSYYERFLLATFNNPARVDLNNDMLWNFLTVPQAADKKHAFDTTVLPPLRQAIERCTAAERDVEVGDAARAIFHDLRQRLMAYHCFCRTMRNSVAWTEGVHGYLQASNEEEKGRYRQRTREMVLDETANAKELLELWRTSDIDFIPIAEQGETLHIYGKNFGELVEKKIESMEEHLEDEPYIDKDYMWREEKWG